ncbi:MAG: hypothetical protein SV422_13530 [Pseudomonadota bacterium]|nr:hypothetical protein [Pseudomonadota bacterium]
MTDDTNRPAVTESMPDERFVAGIRRELDRSCNALDAHTLSRLNRIRHEALARRESRGTRMLLPFGGFVTACVLVLTVSLYMPGTAPNGEAAVPPLEDIDLLVSADSLDLYEDYEFYEWLASAE